MVEGGKASIDENGVLRAGGDAQGVEDGGDAGVGDVVLLDTGLDGVDILNLVIDGNIFSQDGQQAGDLLVSKFLGHDPPRK